MDVQGNFENATSFGFEVRIAEVRWVGGVQQRWEFSARSRVPLTEGEHKREPEPQRVDGARRVEIRNIRQSVELIFAALGMEKGPQGYAAQSKIRIFIHVPK